MSIGGVSLVRWSALLVSLSLVACAPAREEAAATAEDRADAAGPAAEVAGHPITVTELDGRIKERLFAEATEGGNAARVYELRADALQRLVDERLLEAEAKRRGTDPQALLDAELAAVPEPGDEEIAAFYEEIRDRAGDHSREDLAPRIRENLLLQAREETRRAFLAGLRDAQEVTIFLSPPRFEVEAKGPTRGPADAPVTIVEFSDYQCPFCKRAEPVVAKILERYPDRVRYVYRHFPLDSIHPLARRASEAAVCAAEQERFWPFHELLFEHAPALQEERLVAYAKDAGLDLERFQTCLSAGSAAAAVRADLEAGQRVGVRGTPAFFVNGVLLSGARPLEDFVHLIEQELERASAGGGDSS